ncbi:MULTISPECIES: efflux RND transporter permease subunit [Gammaproteobacteria]|uniref:efflux RND transporter permease subunit n=1 Tax=Gammaproteobacteria TaxID=1236 RepID=UPI000DD0A347|nr:MULTISPECIES: efflux RND transporter permease subunit [Gammaproteobacteria]RTE87519.1 efflux RND transporter permease subunit [Aliidiomarina sp. B3213]TCZ92696.1 efflux RND transporter permease subunit [Lysobacter sp. N42]
MEKGQNGGIIAKFLSSTFPPIFIIFAIVAGFIALLLTPKEEDPQIVVPMADILVSAPGLSSEQVSTQVTEPVERLVSQIDGVEYVYSQSQRDSAVITVRFYVGEEREESLVKLYNKLYSNQDQIPSFVAHWAIKPVEIDDVPIVVAALYSTSPETIDSHHLRRVAEEATQTLKALPHTNRVEVVGGESRRIQISLDSSALAAHNTTIDDISFALSASNVQQSAGELTQMNEAIRVESGQFIRSANEMKDLVVNVVNGRPVYLQDVASIVDDAHEPESYTLFYPNISSTSVQQDLGPYPAVFVSVAKQRGANAVSVAQDVLTALDQIDSQWLPENVQVEVIRNYGETAESKVGELVSSLAVAIIVVVVFVGLFLNWRAAAVVAIAIPISYGATLGVDLLFGYTINRVTMFALILALGLIVDDPIAAIDNIERHMSEQGKKTKSAIVGGMLEIRSALLMSTVAIIIVFTPMFFITGMMGPYMGPMAFNVPVAVIFSTLTAFLVTPWLAWKIMKVAENKGAYNPQNSLLYKGYRKILEPALDTAKRRKIFLWSVFGLFIVAAALPALRLVPLKLLPHDNKNEFQVVLDMPEGTPLEATSNALNDLARYLQRVPEVESVSSFAGVASPMDFNGMVRHYFKRSYSYQGELRIVLVDKFERSMQSNEVVTRLRDPLERIAERHEAHIELVQVPPGPPVLATIVAEVYGDEMTSYYELEQAGATVAERLRQEDYVSQVDTSVPAAQQVWRFVVDQEKAARSGIAPADIHSTLAAAIEGRDIGILHVPAEVNPLPIEIRLPPEQRNSLGRLLSLKVRGQQGFVTSSEGELESAPAPMVALSELGEFQQEFLDRPIMHKNLKPVVYVYGEVTGRVPADAVVDTMVDQGSDSSSYRPRWLRTYFSNGSGLGWTVPDDISVVWNGEGEWKITLDVFRDLGIAYGVALLGVYIVMVLQTGLKAVSGIMMLSIPLTIIGIMPGFWFLNLFSADIAGYPNPTLFTATAMIGMIALAGIVVRNALILIEFIQQRLQTGCELKDALFDAGAARTRPILLTAGTTMLANVVITLDPIFNGLAWAVIFGITASTLFTLLVIPVVYYSMYHDSPGHGLPESALAQNSGDQ